MIAITTENERTNNEKWLKRLGMAAFSFFLIKGLLWVAAPFVFYVLI